MAKIDKSLYTKQEWIAIRNQRRLQKQLHKQKDQISKTVSNKDNSVAFVLGNGTSRSAIESELLSELGTIYGCNAIYRTFSPDYLIAVDVKMILEITKSGYQNNHSVWTNHNNAYTDIKNNSVFMRVTQ